jgi:hypothetical protein
MIANLAFTTPLLLVALLALPILWWLLRAVPPAPIRRRFPGVALLLGLKDDDSQTDKTPWWLLLLRMLARRRRDRGFCRARPEPADRTHGRRAAPDRHGCVLGLGAGLERPDRAGRRPAGRGRSRGAARGARGTDRPACGRARVPVGQCMVRAPAVDRAGALRRPITPPRRNGSRASIGAEVFWVSDGLAHEGRDDVLGALSDLGPVSVSRAGGT